jgi:hypothetical protein
MSRAPTLPEIRAAMLIAKRSGLLDDVENPKQWADAVGLSAAECTEFDESMKALGAEPEWRAIVWVTASYMRGLGASYADVTDLWEQVSRILNAIATDGMPGGYLQ